MVFNLVFKWTTSRARDSYGYNVCTLYVDDEKVARTCGGGYDMEGTVLGDWIARKFSEKLAGVIKEPMYGLSFHDPDFDPGKVLVGDTGQTVEQREVAGESLGLERYQAFYKKSSPIPTDSHRIPLMDGACGKSCMIRILEAIGGKYQVVYDQKKVTVATVTMSD